MIKTLHGHEMNYLLFVAILIHVTLFFHTVVIGEYLLSVND